MDIERCPPLTKRCMQVVMDAEAWKRITYLLPNLAGEVRVNPHGVRCLDLLARVNSEDSRLTFWVKCYNDSAVLCLRSRTVHFPVLAKFECDFIEVIHTDSSIEVVVDRYNLGESEFGPFAEIPMLVGREEESTGNLFERVVAGFAI